MAWKKLFCSQSMCLSISLDSLTLTDRWAYRFAQAIFMLFKPFIAFPAERRYIATLQMRADDKVEAKTVWASASALSQQYSGGGSRSASASSKKRSQSQISRAEEAEDDCHARNVRPRLWSSILDVEEEDEDDWYERNLAGRHFNKFGEEEEDDEEDWFEKNLAGRHFDEFGEEERGRPRKRQERSQRSKVTIDTLPSLTNTSAAGDGDPEEMGSSGVLVPSIEPLST